MLEKGKELKNQMLCADCCCEIMKKNLLQGEALCCRGWLMVSHEQRLEPSELNLRKAATISGDLLVLLFLLGVLTFSFFFLFFFYFLLLPPCLL